MFDLKYKKGNIIHVIPTKYSLSPSPLKVKQQKVIGRHVPIKYIYTTVHLKR